MASLSSSRNPSKTKPSKSNCNHKPTESTKHPPSSRSQHRNKTQTDKTNNKCWTPQAPYTATAKPPTAKPCSPTQLLHNPKLYGKQHTILMQINWRRCRQPLGILRKIKELTLRLAALVKCQMLVRETSYKFRIIWVRTNLILNYSLT